MDDREPGYQGLLAAGRTPREAWQAIRDDAARPETRAVFADLASTPEGRAALDWARAAWARHGLPAPFDHLDDTPANGPDSG